MNELCSRFEIAHPDRLGEDRWYSPVDLYRVAAISQTKVAGFGLDDIRDMITVRDPASRQEVLRRHRAELARRIAEMRVSLDLIDGPLGCDHDDIARCPQLPAALAQRIGVVPSRS